MSTSGQSLINIIVYTVGEQYLNMKSEIKSLIIPLIVTLIHIEKFAIFSNDRNSYHFSVQNAS